MKVNIMEDGLLIKSQTSLALMASHLKTAFASLAIAGTTSEMYASKVVEMATEQVTIKYSNAMSFVTKSFIPTTLQDAIVNITLNGAKNTYKNYTKLEAKWLMQEDVVTTQGVAAKILIGLMNDGVPVNYDCLSRIDLDQVIMAITADAALNASVEIIKMTGAEMSTIKRLDRSNLFFVDAEASVAQATASLDILKEKYYAMLPGSGKIFFH